jgi:hypothetical protein
MAISATLSSATLSILGDTPDNIINADRATAVPALLPSAVSEFHTSGFHLV